MNVIIQQHDESATSTNGSAFLFGIDARDVGAQIETSPALEVAPAAEMKTLRPRRPGTNSLSETIGRREHTDPGFARRMHAARIRVGSQIYADQPDSLAALRLARGLSQSSLAVTLGTSQSHVAKIETGKVKIQFLTATLLADALRVSLDQLRPLIENALAAPMAQGK